MLPALLQGAFPPTEGPRVVPRRFRSLTEEFKIGAELSLNPAAVSGERGASSESNSDVCWDDLAPRNAHLHIASDVTQKPSRICPWKPLRCVTVSVFA